MFLLRLSSFPTFRDNLVRPNTPSPPSTMAKLSERPTRARVVLFSNQRRALYGEYPIASLKSDLHLQTSLEV